MEYLTSFIGHEGPESLLQLLSTLCIYYRTFYRHVSTVSKRPLDTIWGRLAWDTWTSSNRLFLRLVIKGHFGNTRPFCPHFIRYDIFWEKGLVLPKRPYITCHENKRLELCNLIPSPAAFYCYPEGLFSRVQWFMRQKVRLQGRQRGRKKYKLP